MSQQSALLAAAKAATCLWFLLNATVCWCFVTTTPPALRSSLQGPTLALVCSSRRPTTQLYLQRRGVGGKTNDDDAQKRDRVRADDPNDPRAFRKRMKRKEQLEAALIRQSRRRDKNSQQQQQQQQQKKNDSSSLSSSSATPGKLDEPLVRTIGGGPSMIFEMARRMMIWETVQDDSAFAGAPTQQQQQGQKTQRQRQKQQQQQGAAAARRVLPRWHPTSGISDANPQFRTRSPVMNNQGYAGTIWRNVRKRKPAQWRYALRTFDRMERQRQQSSPSPASAASSLMQTAGSTNTAGAAVDVERTNIHYEGALLACAKLGLWKRAMEIFNEVQARQDAAQLRNRDRSVHVTDRMVTSLVRACVQAARRQPKPAINGDGDSIGDSAARLLTERRAPLDAALEVLKDKCREDDIPMDANQVNAIAAAYLSLGLRADTAAVIHGNLSDRWSRPEAVYGAKEPFNVNDVGAKDKSSYTILVTSAVSEGDWAGAVDALRDMTEAGLYPNAKHLNTWTEVGASRSWKKKRDEYWMEKVQVQER